MLKTFNWCICSSSSSSLFFNLQPANFDLQETSKSCYPSPSPTKVYKSCSCADQKDRVCRSLSVGASISPTGFVPQHTSRHSYFAGKNTRGNAHPIKWLEHDIDGSLISMHKLYSNNGGRVHSKHKVRKAIQMKVLDFRLRMDFRSLQAILLRMTHGLG